MALGQAASGAVGFPGGFLESLCDFLFPEGGLTDLTCDTQPITNCPFCGECASLRPSYHSLTGLKLPFLFIQCTNLLSTHHVLCVPHMEGQGDGVSARHLKGLDGRCSSTLPGRPGRGVLYTVVVRCSSCSSIWSPHPTPRSHPSSGQGQSSAASFTDHQTCSLQASV